MQDQIRTCKGQKEDGELQIQLTVDYQKYIGFNLNFTS